ncbi:hypothetical protein COCOR_04402 [Corallococcus coralloides DSM 2259]|uniref:Uncharacterized protein n=1 Tax=Corallococcus coralloides (strain ATCC 25202 / DSM 2259 / NBRC 100086 / M2) TaxID=1144275 RepID=H8N214_CORCM|nr:hypothetical protein [Corallococcus coralloides]AFE05809.1 hypothetical protein COCOR_04402 [Corallococcus coralloides DSM 2259]
MSSLAPREWIQKAWVELAQLAPMAEVEPDDAWRALVLAARLLDSPFDLVPPTELLRRLPDLVQQAGLPEPAALLTRLASELDGEADPEGPLLDVLLDIDDAMGVLNLLGDAKSAASLAHDSIAFIARHPSRIRALERFAVLRQATLRPELRSAAIWTAVIRAPESSSDIVSKEARRDERPSSGWVPPVVVLPLPVETFRPQAWTGTNTVSLQSEDGVTQAWLYEDAGRLLLEIRGGLPPPTKARLVARRRVDARELAVLDLQLTVEGHTAYVDLRNAGGQGNPLHGLLARTGLPADEVELRLVVMHER